MIGAVLPALANFAGSYMNYQSQQATNSQNAALVREQNRASIAQWERETAYNNPVNQVQRLRAAGFNPGILYGSSAPSNVAASSPTLQGSRDIAPQAALLGDTLLQSQMTMAQIRNLNAQSHLSESQAKYQDYQNAVEEALQNIPIGYVYTDNGEVSVTYGNYHVVMSERELKQLGLNINGLQYELADLYYDMFVKFGDISFTDFPPSLDGNKNAIDEGNALRGDKKVRYLAGEMAELAYDAAKAQDSGKVAYKEWLDKHGDEPLVKLLLTLQGLFQSTDINLDSFLRLVPAGKAARAARFFTGSK